MGVPQGRELVNAVPSLINRSHTRLKWAPVAGKFVAKHASCPDWLFGIIDGLPGTWSSIEDFRTQVSTISTNIYPWKGNKNTNTACCVHETQQLSAMELQFPGQWEGVAETMLGATKSYELLVQLLPFLRGK